MTRNIIRYFMALIAFTVTVQVVLCDDAMELARDRLFHVDVEGIAASEKLTGDPSVTRLAGKAFAVTPDVLITAGHVVEDVRFWRNKGAPGGVSVPDREVTVSWMSGYGLGAVPKSSSEFHVTASSVDTADVAILVIPQISTEFEPFQLNTNDIDAAASYRGLLVENQPSSKDSIERPDIVALKPVRHSREFQGMYVFDAIDTSREIQQGDSGSPVLDSDDRVVGLISGRTKDGQVLVTLASWFERSSLILDQRIRDQDRRIVDLREELEELKNELIAMRSEIRVQTGDINVTATLEAAGIDIVDARLAHGTGERMVEGRIDFPVPFSSTPKVMVALGAIDIDTNVHGGRLNIWIKEIDKEGFVYRINTWADSRIFWVKGNWVAVAN